MNRNCPFHDYRYNWFILPSYQSSLQAAKIHMCRLTARGRNEKVECKSATSSTQRCLGESDSWPEALYNLGRGGNWSDWQSQWYRSALCCYSLPEPANTWTSGAASRHTTAQSATLGLHPVACDLLFISHRAEGRRLSWLEHTIG